MVDEPVYEEDLSAFEMHGGGSGYVDYKQLEVDPGQKLSIEIGLRLFSSPRIALFVPSMTKFRQHYVCMHHCNLQFSSDIYQGQRSCIKAWRSAR